MRSAADNSSSLDSAFADCESELTATMGNGRPELLCVGAAPLLPVEGVTNGALMLRVLAEDALVGLSRLEVAVEAFPGVAFFAFVGGTDGTDLPGVGLFAVAFLIRLGVVEPAPLGLANIFSTKRVVTLQVPFAFCIWPTYAQGCHIV
jgi:hypothetical protein